MNHAADAVLDEHLARAEPHWTKPAVHERAV
jgi:hypothetical protein